MAAADQHRAVAELLEGELAPRADSDRCDEGGTREAIISIGATASTGKGSPGLRRCPRPAVRASSPAGGWRCR